VVLDSDDGRVLKLGQHKAHGTSLVALVFTGVSGAMTYALKGSIDILAAIHSNNRHIYRTVSARYAHTLPEWKLKRAFGAF
jgi:uncharacterized membrane protein YfcA